MAYLAHGKNGFLVPDGGRAEVYADAAIRLLRDEAARGELVRGCLAARNEYSAEDMARRFASGVEQALHAGSRGHGGKRERQRLSTC
jgi:glycosyltransferase involved in cell wall biosynthesis